MRLVMLLALISAPHVSIPHPVVEPHVGPHVVVEPHVTPHPIAEPHGGATEPHASSRAIGEERATHPPVVVRPIIVPRVVPQSISSDSQVPPRRRARPAGAGLLPILFFRLSLAVLLVTILLLCIFVARLRLRAKPRVRTGGS